MWHCTWVLRCPRAKCKKVRETGTGISVCIAIVGPTYVPSEDCASQKHPAITTHEASLPHSRLQAKKQKSWQQQNISLDAWSTKLQHYLTLSTRLGWLSDLHFRLGRHREISASANKSVLTETQLQGREDSPTSMWAWNWRHQFQQMSTFNANATNFNRYLNVMLMLLIGLCHLVRPGKAKHISSLS